MNEWISIKKRLPRSGSAVLVAWRNIANKKFRDIATFHKKNPHRFGGWHFTYCDVDGTNELDDSQVTHWQPLPNHP